MALTADIRVASIARTVELTVSPHEAERGRDYLRAAVEANVDEPYVIALIRSALDAIATNREYGGH